MIILPAYLEKFSSLKDKTYKLTFETNELTPEQLSGIGQTLQQFGYLAFKSEPFKKQEQEMVEGLKSEYDDTKKSKAQRLRGVLYRWFEEDPQGYEVFDDFYNHHLEKVISHFKAKLP